MLKITYYLVPEINWQNYFFNPLAIRRLFNYSSLTNNDKLNNFTRAIDQKNTGCYNNMWVFVFSIYNIII